jgi:hypothetical protein
VVAAGSKGAKANSETASRAKQEEAFMKKRGGAGDRSSPRLDGARAHHQLAGSTKEPQAGEAWISPEEEEAAGENKPLSASDLRALCNLR